MIRREEPDALWVITQAAHAYVAGQIAEHWAIAYAPRQELILAAHIHDAGWWLNERKPRRTGHGMPRTFTEMELREHFDIWECSIAAVFAQNRYAALLTSLHCDALYEQRLRFIDDPPEDKRAIKAFRAKRHAWQQDLIRALRDHPRYGEAVTPARLDENLRLLQVWDYLSLVLCMSPVHEQTLDNVPLGNGQRASLRIRADGSRGMRLDPFPLGNDLALWIDARRVTDAPFDSDEALRTALTHAAYAPLEFTIRE